MDWVRGEISRLLGTRRFLGVFVTLSLTLNSMSLARNFSGTLSTALSRDLDSTAANAALEMEPLLVADLSDFGQLSIASLIVKPLDEHTAALVDRLILSGKLNLLGAGGGSVSLFQSLTARSLSRWSNDGYQVRFSPSVEGRLAVSEVVEFYGRVGLFGQLNEYSQRTDGSTIPVAGITERVGILFRKGIVSLDLRLLAEQRLESQWRNDLGNLQVLQASLSEAVAVGFSHEYASGIVDETTGRFQSLQLFSDRTSRISLFVELTL